MSMRVSTNNIFALGTASITERQADLVKLQQQLSTGKRILTPSDDPVASAQILEVTQSRDRNSQFMLNGNDANSAVAMSETSLQSVVNLLQNVKQLAVNAGNPTLALNERSILQSELQARYQELLGLANSTDGSGLYLFSGYQGTTRPFEEVAPGVVAYFGDQGQRQIQISPSRALPVSDSGRDIFQRIKEGNGSFVTEPPSSPLNTGTGIISPGSVLDPVKWKTAGQNGLPANFSLNFHVDNAVIPAVTTYDIVDNTAAPATSLLTGAAPAAGPYARVYQPNATIELKKLPTDPVAAPAFDYGAQLSIEGAPATGDTFTVRASKDVQLFDTLTNLGNTLLSNKTSSTQAAEYQNRLNMVMQGLDNALTNITSIQADIGARMNEIDSVNDSQSDLNLQYNTQLKDLGALDYAKAISDFSLTQTYLEAAQKTFMQTQKLSLFDQI
jgi:flagellar hook-associated protein 3 FlgL